MGTGVGQGENRAVEAAQRAISNPLLEDTSIEGAKGVIVNITGGPDLSLSEASEATALITKVADPDANVIYGIVTDESMGNAVKVTVIATGFNRGVRKGVATPTDIANYMRVRVALPACPPPRRARPARRRRRLLPQDAQPEVGRRPPRASTSTSPRSCAARAVTEGPSSVPPFTRDLACRACGREYLVSGALREPALRDGDAHAVPLLLRAVDGRLRPGQRGAGAAGRDGEGGGSPRRGGEATGEARLTATATG